MHVFRNSEARSRNHCCRGKEISIAYSACVSVEVVILHTERMRRIILSSVAWLSYFSHNTVIPRLTSGPANEFFG